MSYDSEIAAAGAALGVAVPDIWRQTWPQSVRSYSAGDIFFLQTDWVRQACAELEFGEGVTGALLDCAGAVAADPALARLAWHLHWLLIWSGLEPRVGNWPAPPLDGPSAAPMFYGLIALSGLPHLREIHGARGLPETITVDTLSDIETWAADFHTWEGAYRFHTFGWLQHHLRGHLLKVGRLEYVPGSYGYPFRWYRSATTGKVLCLAEGGCLLRGDGQFASADEGEERAGLWQTSFAETGDSVTGHPVSAAGYVCAETRTLDLGEWQEVLRRDDPVMTVHIPSKGRMGPEECAASFRDATAIFTARYPEVVWRAFTCHSWLLDPQFDQLQPVPPNIAAFMRMWYLHPVEGADERQTWQRVFSLFGNWDQRDWAKAPRDTSLRRAILDFVAQGKHLRSGGAVIFAEDLAAGREPYRSGDRAEVCD